MDLGILRLAQTRCTLRDYIEYWLDIGRRAGDHAENFTRRSLLLQRLLEFIKQPNIFDGNDRLVSKSFEELELRRGEGAHFGAARIQ